MDFTTATAGFKQTPSNEAEKPEDQSFLGDIFSRLKLELVKSAATEVPVSSPPTTAAPASINNELEVAIKTTTNPQLNPIHVQSPPVFNIGLKSIDVKPIEVGTTPTPIGVASSTVQQTEATKPTSDIGTTDNKLIEMAPQTLTLITLPPQPVTTNQPTIQSDPNLQQQQNQQPLSPLKSFLKKADNFIERNVSGLKKLLTS